MQKGEVAGWATVACLTLFFSNYQIGWDDSAIAALYGEEAVKEKKAAESKAANSINEENLNIIYKEIAAEKTWLDWRLLKAIIIHESGEGKLLNSEGTGDCTARNGQMPDDWTPETPLCWGRGLGQIDYGSHKEWLSANDWRDPRVNIRKAAGILEAAYNQAAQDSRVPEKQWVYTALAAYNSGWGNVSKSLAEGKDTGARTTKKQVDGKLLLYPEAVFATYAEISQKYDK